MQVYKQTHKIYRHISCLSAMYLTKINVLRLLLSSQCNNATEACSKNIC